MELEKKEIPSTVTIVIMQRGKESSSQDGMEEQKIWVGGWEDTNESVGLQKKGIYA